MTELIENLHGEEPDKKKQKVMPPCEQCHAEISKYTCPKCQTKTCSLNCVKLHKSDKNCDGSRPIPKPEFEKVEKIGQYDDEQSIKDQEFLYTMNKIVRGKSPEPLKTDEKMPDASPDKVLEMNLTKHEKFLLSNAHSRRIWLKILNSGDAKESHHENFSDTIFWTIKLRFVRELVRLDGESEPTEIEEHSYTVKNIPETLTSLTLLKQFITPKLSSPVISPNELDAEKMKPFQDAGLDHLLVYMKVPLEDKDRYYVIDKSKTILDNLRNRFIHGHPTFVITLDNEFNHWEMLNDSEAQELNEHRKQESRDMTRQNNIPKPHGHFDANRNGKNKRRNKPKNRAKTQDLDKEETGPKPSNSGFASRQNKRDRGSYGFRSQRPPAQAAPVYGGYPPQQQTMYGGYPMQHGLYGTQATYPSPYAYQNYQYPHYNQLKAAQSGWNAAVQYNSSNAPKSSGNNRRIVESPPPPQGPPPFAAEIPLPPGLPPRAQVDRPQVFQPSEVEKGASNPLVAYCDSD